jgi:GNAT superfamily N-acetyltransferase
MAEAFKCPKCGAPLVYNAREQKYKESVSCPYCNKVVILPLEIIRAVPSEAITLKEIAIASKSYWGYSESLITQWAQTSIITPKVIVDDLVFKACVNGPAVGWYRLILKVFPALLEDLWVLPVFIGCGIGRALFLHAVDQARGNGMLVFELEADPHAVPFYQRMGCKVIGESLSEWGRKIPHMRYEI